MPKQTEIVYIDAAGKPVLRQGGSGKVWDLVGIYGSVSAAQAKTLHAALGELLTDLAAEPKVDDTPLAAE